MRHRKAKITLDRNAAQRRALLRNLAISLIRHEHMTTTHARARAVRTLTERLVTISKTKSLAARRLLLSMTNSATTAEKLLAVIGPRYQQTPGGYLRMTKIGPRTGDGAAMVRLEFITRPS